MLQVSAVLIFVVFFALMVILSDKLGITIGILGMLFTFIMSGWLCGIAPAAIVGYFPTNTIITLFIASTFFCYVQQTGLFGGVVARIMHASKGHTALIPFALVISSAILACIGGAEVAPLLMSPIAFAIVSYAGLHPLLAVISTYCGTAITGMFFWTGGGSTIRTIVEGMLDEGLSYTASYETVLFLAGFFIIFYVCAYFTFRRHKLDSGKISEYFSKKPESLNREQKFALVTVIVVILVTMIPVLIQTLLYANPVTAWMSTHLTLKQNCLLGVLAFHIAGVGDVKDIMKNRIPWTSFINIGGCCMIVASAKDLGITDMLANGLATAIPSGLIPAALVLISALLSFTSNQFAIVPLLGPMAVVLGEAAGLSPATIIVCIIAGCNATGISPVSMGGSLQLIGANEEQRASIFKKQWLTAVIVMAAMVIVSLAGVWKLIDGIFF